MRSLFLVLLSVLGSRSIQAKEKPPTVYTIPLPPKPDFSPLEWLVGEWNGTTTGRGAQGKVHLSAEFTLDRRFMILREEVTLVSSNAVPTTQESWMGVLSASPSDATFLLRMYSSTGFILRYRVTVEGPVIHFNPEGGEQPPPGWLFRRMVQRSGDAEFDETVQVAPPHKSFFEYYTARLTRAPHPAAQGAPPTPLKTNDSQPSTSPKQENGVK
jgi:hypothetical protein